VTTCAGAREVRLRGLPLTLHYVFGAAPGLAEAGEGSDALGEGTDASVYPDAVNGPVVLPLLSPALRSSLSAGDHRVRASWSARCAAAITLTWWCSFSSSAGLRWSRIEREHDGLTRRGGICKAIAYLAGCQEAVIPNRYYSPLRL